MLPLAPLPPRHAGTNPTPPGQSPVTPAPGHCHTGATSPAIPPQHPFCPSHPQDEGFPPPCPAGRGHRASLLQTTSWGCHLRGRLPGGDPGVRGHLGQRLEVAELLRTVPATRASGAIVTTVVSPGWWLLGEDRGGSAMGFGMVPAAAAPIQPQAALLALKRALLPPKRGLGGMDLLSLETRAVSPRVLLLPPPPSLLRGPAGEPGCTSTSRPCEGGTGRSASAGRSSAR